MAPNRKSRPAAIPRPHFVQAAARAGRSSDDDVDDGEVERGEARFTTKEERRLDMSASQEGVALAGGVKRTLDDAFNHDDAESRSVPAQRIRLDVNSTE